MPVYLWMCPVDSNFQMTDDLDIWNEYKIMAKFAVSKWKFLFPLRPEYAGTVN